MTCGHPRTHTLCTHQRRLQAGALCRVDRARLWPGTVWTGPQGKEPGDSLSPGLPGGLEAVPQGGFESPPPTGPPAGSRLVVRADTCIRAGNKALFTPLTFMTTLWVP